MKHIIRVTQVSTHPHFGGEKIRSCDFELDDGKSAGAKYAEMSLDDVGGYAFTTMQIILV